jgi:hypothetical protein
MTTLTGRATVHSASGRTGEVPSTIQVNDPPGACAKSTSTSQRFSGPLGGLTLPLTVHATPIRSLGLLSLKSDSRPFMLLGPSLMNWAQPSLEDRPMRVATKALRSEAMSTVGSR